ncbi:TetR/AcrR family transcriptional regulator [Streptomyces inhibens]|uniref:TetR/AcrR family transcriptional regulator n=1 Tax=Streptomyces inhibens TaxID=2293571 RepID=UPI001EE6B6B7|nr:TetR family transcriptional regulator C-terminal domain-containing protein [Streptomyces inhibens]UKY53753.1 TetR family transcriptional regulator C-terminal domain-containing protein [Streptomyces inhibens]
MPKKVDHEARRQEISEALWRIASTRGLDGASLRDVAAEADISLGRLQHYFRTRDEMLLFALRHINQLAARRIRERIEALTEEPTPREVLRACLSGMLPLDDKSRTGLLVGAAYYSRAVHDETLRAEARDGIPQLRAFFADQLRLAAERGELPPERATEDEAMLLISMADGLASYVLLDVHAPETALRLLDLHLANLFGTGESGEVGETEKRGEARERGEAGEPEESAGFGGTPVVNSRLAPGLTPRLTPEETPAPPAPGPSAAPAPR